MAQDLRTEAEAFAKSYASFFSSPACSSSEHVADVAAQIAGHYREKTTILTNGASSCFEVRSAL